MPQQSAVYFWDFTVSAAKAQRDEILTWCKQNAKQWVFQLEKGAENGYLHYQVRVNLVERKRRLGAPDHWECNGNASPTNTKVVQGKRTFEYVMKEDTREDGPWSDKDEPRYVPRAMRTLELREEQQEMLDYMEVQNDRQILFVQDEGNAGKSTFGKWLICNRAAVYIPPNCTTGQQMAGYYYSAVKDAPGKTFYVIFDIPRATNERQWREIAPTIEQIKDGYAYDGRNAARFCLTEPPRVVVFFNGLPGDLELEFLFTPDKIVKF